MPLDFDPTPDFTQVIDGLETVTLLRRGSGMSGTVVAHALRRAATTREATVHNRYDTEKEVASGGLCTAGDAVWHLPTAELPAAPRLGDMIVQGGGHRFTVLEVRRSTLGGSWRCTTRNLVLAYALDDTINVLQAAYAKGAGGAAEATWRTWKTGIRARIQPFSGDVGTKHAARRTVRRYRIFLAEEVDLDHRHRIQGPDGTLYRINGTQGVKRIGEPQTIDAEIVQ